MIYRQNGNGHPRRIVSFVLYDDTEKRRIEGLAKIRSFHRERNMTVERLPANSMSTPKSLKALANSREYRHLGEPTETEDCVQQFPWQSAVYPTCNTLHEFGDLTALEFDDEAGEGQGEAALTTTSVRTRLMANGYWRDVWVVKDDHGVRVIKTLRYEHKLTLRNYDRNRRDAMALEHLTSSKYVVDIYGYCSAAGLFEYSNGGDITNAIWPRNESLALSPIRKLQIATQGAMALAAVHNADQEGQATIAHTDIGPDQFILIDNRYKLNDFNRARFLLKFKSNGTNCPYFVNKNPGKNRSPEEYGYKPQTEKVT
jgi:serine/threonine protein kinase